MRRPQLGVFLEEQVGALLRFFLPPLDPGTRVPALEAAPTQRETHSCRATGWSKETDGGKRAWFGFPNLASPWVLPPTSWQVLSEFQFPHSLKRVRGLEAIVTSPTLETS